MGAGGRRRDTIGLGDTGGDECPEGLWRGGVVCSASSLLGARASASASFIAAVMGGPQSSEP